MNSALPRLLVAVLVLWTGLALVSGHHRPEFCSLPAVTGPCKARMPRFFYNPTSKQCEKFVYGGCKGNKNNFETLQECRNACVEKPGTCPKPDPSLITICLVKCADDWACPGSQKCCSFGCLVDCANPV